MSPPRNLARTHVALFRDLITASRPQINIYTPGLSRKSDIFYGQSQINDQISRRTRDKNVNSKNHFN